MQQQPEWRISSAEASAAAGGGSAAALRKVALAHGVGGAVTPVAPHRNSQRSADSFEQLQARTEPASWKHVSRTASEAGFVNHDDDGQLSAAASNYKRRRLGNDEEGPAWFEAVAADVPAVADWWKATARLASTKPALGDGDIASTLQDIIQGEKSERPARITALYDWAHRSMDVDQRMEDAMASAADASGVRWRHKGSEADQALLRRHVPEQVKAAAAKAKPPPAPPAPPPTLPQNPDRKPHDGFSGDLTFGDPTAGAGAFIRFGQHLGGKCAFFAESDPEAAEIAAEEAPTAHRFEDICAVAPEDIPAVFTLLGGPECQPFSRAGREHGFRDARSDTLLWFFWCLAVRQFPTAFIENSAQLQRSNGGKDWQVCTALAAAIGYKVSVQRDCASRWKYAEVRQRMFITLIRDDLFDVWGSPPALVHPPLLPPQTLESILLPPSHPAVLEEIVSFKAILEESGDMGEWVAPIAGARPGQPQCAWKVGDGKWGKRGFTHATPAHKVFGDMP